MTKASAQQSISDLDRLDQLLLEASKNPEGIVTDQNTGLEYTLPGLISMGAYLNIKDLDGKTPLMHSCERLILNNVRSLISESAEVNLQDSKGMSALMMLSSLPRANSSFSSTIQHEIYEELIEIF